jgi:hypothetical protein
MEAVSSKLISKVINFLYANTAEKSKATTVDSHLAPDRLAFCEAQSCLSSRRNYLINAWGKASHRGSPMAAGADSRHLVYAETEISSKCDNSDKNLLVLLRS